jgi:hypothetical protein
MLANIAVVSLATYRGVEYMDSVAFCGQVCHTPMKPEFAAHGATAHSRVKCVDCHVGSGASSYVAAKLAGTRRVLAVAAGSYARPIVAAPDKITAAAETCERCHSPDTRRGDTVRRFYEFAEDEQNTESVTTLRVRVGGGRTAARHADPGRRVEYSATGEDRGSIPYVRVTEAGGDVREYLAEGWDGERASGLPLRLMDCTDCHNRPSHDIAATAERAVDEAIARGEIPKTLPFIRREAAKALKSAYSSEDAALSGISNALETFYAGPYGTDRHDVSAAIAATRDIYSRSVFPDMNVGFGTYPNHLGHTDAPGCFRCHDESHRTSQGRTIGQDCSMCHEIE